MESKILFLLLFVAYSSAVRTISPDNLQHSEDKNQRAMKEYTGSQQKKILEFLSAFDKVQKSTKTRLVSKATELQAYAKKFGETIRSAGLDDSQPSSPFSHKEDIARFLEIYPLSRKNFRKATPLSSKKSKKRACFWKYCVQTK